MRRHKLVVRELKVPGCSLLAKHILDLLIVLILLHCSQEAQEAKALNERAGGAGSLKGCHYFIANNALGLGLQHSLLS